MRAGWSAWFGFLGSSVNSIVVPRSDFRIPAPVNVDDDLIPRRSVRPLGRVREYPGIHSSRAADGLIPLYSGQCIGGRGRLMTLRHSLNLAGTYSLRLRAINRARDATSRLQGDRENHACAAPFHHTLVIGVVPRQRAERQDHRRARDRRPSRLYSAAPGRWILWFKREGQKSGSTR